MAFRSEKEEGVLGGGGGGGLEPELSLKLGSGHQEGSAKDEIVKKKKMTIFFNGDMRVLDVTETQARAIICSAMKQIENEKKSRIHQGSDTGNTMFRHKDAPSHENVSVSSSQAVVPPSIQPYSELSMKQSLQRFLQKRKARLAAASPYSQKQLLSLSLS